jgi:hypothetical protein
LFIDVRPFYSGQLRQLASNKALATAPDSLRLFLDETAASQP